MADNQTTPAGARTQTALDLAPKSWRVAWFDLANYLVGWTPWYASETAAREAALERELRRPHLSDYERAIQDRPF